MSTQNILIQMIFYLTMPKMIRTKQKPRNRIEIRITKDFTKVDLAFQKYCMIKGINEARKIRELIRDFLDKRGRGAIKPLEEYAGKNS